MSGHTPGPWKAETKAFGGGPLRPCAVVRELPNNTIPDVFDMSTLCIAEGIAERNAGLIAAAPELLACVERFVEMFGPVELPNTEGAAWLANCRAAISKAIGE